MQIGRIEGTTRVLGKAQGYLGLPVRDEQVIDAATSRNENSMVSAWLPTSDEIAALNAGASVHLRVIGMVHPPVVVSVGEVPANDGPSVAPYP